MKIDKRLQVKYSACYMVLSLGLSLPVSLIGKYRVVYLIGLGVKFERVNPGIKIESLFKIGKGRFCVVVDSGFGKIGHKKRPYFW